MFNLDTVNSSRSQINVLTHVYCKYVKTCASCASCVMCARWSIYKTIFHRKVNLLMLTNQIPLENHFSPPQISNALKILISREQAVEGAWSWFALVSSQWRQNTAKSRWHSIDPRRIKVTLKYPLLVLPFGHLNPPLSEVPGFLSSCPPMACGCSLEPCCCRFTGCVSVVLITVFVGSIMGWRQKKMASKYPHKDPVLLSTRWDWLWISSGALEKAADLSHAFYWIQWVWSFYCCVYCPTKDCNVHFRWEITPH